MNKARECLSYKGYAGTCETSLEDMCLHGRILHIDDLITYEGESVPELKAGFEAAVDRYLAHCKAIGKQPNKPYNGSLNVRLGGDRHKRLAQEAHDADVSINEVIGHAIDFYFEAKEPDGCKTVFILHEKVISKTASTSTAIQYQQFSQTSHVAAATQH